MDANADPTKEVEVVECSEGGLTPWLTLDGKIRWVKVHLASREGCGDPDCQTRYEERRLMVPRSMLNLRATLLDPASVLELKQVAWDMGLK